MVFRPLCLLREVMRVVISYDGGWLSFSGEMAGRGALALHDALPIEAKPDDLGNQRLVCRALL